MALPLFARFAALEWQSVNTAGTTDSSDESLVAAAKNGNRAAFGHLYERFARSVHGILLARVPNFAAEDLVQEVFLQALHSLPSLRDASSFGAWIAAIARNRAADFHRSSKPQDSLDDSSSPKAQTENHSGAIGLTEGIALLNAVRELPEAYREPLILRFVEGLTGPEIAARTGLTHGSVRVNLHRGMQILREKWHRAAPQARPRAENEKLS